MALASKIAAFAALVSIGISAGSAAPKRAFELAHSSKWHVNYSAGSCTLAREFGTGDDKVTLLMARTQPGHIFRLTVFGKKMKVPEMDPGAEIEFGPNGGKQRIPYFVGKMDGGEPAIVFREGFTIRALTKEEKAQRDRVFKRKDIVAFNYPDVSEAEEKAVSELRLGNPLRNPIILKTGPMDKAFKALRDCNDEILQLWGYDPAKRTSLQSEPTPKTPPGNWVTDVSYPLYELSNGGRGIVHFRLDLDDTGKATKCEILDSPSSKDFQKTVCSNLMKNARLSPALDSAGNPVPWYWQSTVVFLIGQ